jgi:hypothetical protein
MDSTVAVHTKGFGFSFRAVRNSWIAHEVFDDSGRNRAGYACLTRQASCVRSDSANCNYGHVMDLIAAMARQPGFYLGCAMSTVGVPYDMEGYRRQIPS